MKDKVASNVIRTAGNLVDDYALARIEYAVDRISAGHLMFMIEAKKAAAVFIA
jgi:carbonic anhydrase